MAKAAKTKTPTKSKTRAKKTTKSNSAVSFQIQLSEKSKNKFEFNMDAKIMVEAVDKLIAVTGFVSNSSVMRRHMLVSYGGNLFIIGYSSDTNIAIDTGIEVADSGAFNFEPEVLKGIIKGRGNIQFKYDGTELAMKDGRFNGVIKTTPVTVDQIPAVNDIFGKGLKRSNGIGSELLSRLREGVQRTRLIDHLDDRQASQIYIDYEDGVLKAITKTRWASSLFECQFEAGKEKPFRMSLTNEVFNVINKVLGDEAEQSASFFISEAGFRVLSKNVVVSLPPVQETEQSSIDEFYALMDMVNKKKPSGEYQINVRDCTDTINNLLVLVTEKASGVLRAKFASKGVNLSFSNDNGSVANTFSYVEQKAEKGKKKTKSAAVAEQTIQLYPKIFNDLLTNIKLGSFNAKTYAVRGAAKSNVFILTSDHSDADSDIKLTQFCALVQ